MLTDTLVEQIEGARWLGRRSLDGLTDEEFWWEPVPGCWTISRNGTPAPEGSRVVDDPSNPPFTTIAWRVVHMTLGPWNWINNLEGARRVVRAGRRSFLDEDRVDLPEPPLPTDAPAAVVLWDEVVLRFREQTASFDDPGLTTTITFPWGRSFAPVWIVSHVLRELLHHEAEVGCVRDLYRHTIGRGSS